ncbi:MAG: hypothetical protein LBO02_00315, partial [Holosporaceae bacterium]|nr:hypothetical protein [Holosporaceae bacterium]
MRKSCVSFKLNIASDAAGDNSVRRADARGGIFLILEVFCRHFSKKFPQNLIDKIKFSSKNKRRRDSESPTADENFPSGQDQKAGSGLIPAKASTKAASTKIAKAEIAFTRGAKAKAASTKIAGSVVAPIGVAFSKAAASTKIAKAGIASTRGAKAVISDGGGLIGYVDNLKFWFGAKRTIRRRLGCGGYVMILMCVLVPVLLLGVKLSVDQTSLKQSQLYKGAGQPSKYCAREAALAAAQKYNPGLTLKQQKEYLLTLADDVYNSYPVSYNSVIQRAIPGLDVQKYKWVPKGRYSPLQAVSNGVSSPEVRVVEYIDATGDCYRVKPYVNTGNVLPIFQCYDAVYKMPKSPYFTTEDVCKDVCYAYSGPFPHFTIRSENLDNFKSVSYLSQTASEDTPIAGTAETKYRKRKNPNDDKVQISIENDKIKVQTDLDVGFAIPAVCNVDMVLAIPVNGAASNVSNLDVNSVTVDVCYKSDSTTPTADGKKTPIYEISQALRTFLKENFLFTRGANVGLIPYSGNCSIPLSRLAWTERPKIFVFDYYLSNQNSYPPYLRGAFLYSTLYKSLYDLTTSGDHWGAGAYSITNLMCRTGRFTTESSYGNNILCYGDLLSTADPSQAASGDYSPKYRRKPCANCYLGYANLLSMQIEKDLISGWGFHPNPFHIVELQADVMRICDLLNLFYPISLITNKCSNFIFIAAEWANNLFQSWSNDPVCSAVNTAGESPATTYGRLSRPSKTTAGRKKAVILVANKPDWFEPQELTYLGFNNDFSELPMMESDCIRFDINYSDTSRKFYDGSAYDGTIAGPKKILKYTTQSGTVSRNASSGYYETSGSSAVTGRLSFPRKYLLKVVVEP